MSEESALQSCQQLIQQGLANHDVYLARFHLLLRLGRTREAEEGLEDYLKAQPSAPGIATLCEYYENQGRLSEAARCRAWLNPTS